MTNPFLDPNYYFDKSLLPSTKTSLINWYYQSNITDYNHLLTTKPESYWLKRGQLKALHLFHQAAEHIPAYQDFLKKHHVKPNTIRTYQNFQNLPTTDKPNYITQYPLEALCWHGQLSQSNIVSYSSGSTGSPYLWPRSTYQDIEGAFQFEHLLTSLFGIDKKSTLFINCFSMGNYVAGVYVYTSTKLLSQKGYPLTTVSPGINYQDALNMLTKLADKYDQVILAGYPPFIRDLIEIGIDSGTNFKRLNLKFFFASEFFSETWRDHTLELTNNHSPLTDSTNIYGTADSAIFSFETPTTIVITKLADDHPQLNQNLFHSDLSPTLTQFNPLLTFYESINRELTLTANTGVPLIRYNLKDEGDILPISTVNRIFDQHGFNLTSTLQQHHLDTSSTQLPMVYLTNRTDGAVSFYAIKIFPEYVRGGLEIDTLKHQLSGKFTLISGHTNNHRPELTVHVELTRNAQPSASLKHQVLNSVQQSLRNRCSEYNFLEQSIGKRATPKIVLHLKNHSQYFKVGIKQKWIIN